MGKNKVLMEGLWRRKLQYQVNSLSDFHSVPYVAKSDYHIRHTIEKIPTSNILDSMSFWCKWGMLSSKDLKNWVTYILYLTPLPANPLLVFLINCKVLAARNQCFFPNAVPHFYSYLGINTQVSECNFFLWGKNPIHTYVYTTAECWCSSSRNIKINVNN